MNDSDKISLLARYNQKLAQHGFRPEALCWGGGKQRQNLRFRVLTEIGVQATDSVLDIGCGFADLYGYLRRNGWSGQYCGVDLNPRLLDVAEDMYPKVTVRCVDILSDPPRHRFDWVLSAGIFNARLEHENNLTYMHSMVRAMFDACNRGVACDFMSTYVDFQRSESYHTDPLELVSFVRQLTDKVVLRMDYLPYEFAVYLRKEALANESPQTDLHASYQGRHVCESG